MTKRVSMLNGKNKNQDYDFGQLMTEILTNGVAKSTALFVEEQAVPNGTVKINPGICVIDVVRTVDNNKAFKLFCESNGVENITVTGAVGNIGAVIAFVPKAKIDDGSSNPPDGQGVFDFEYVEGVGLSPLTDNQINTATGDLYYWIRLADIEQAATVTNSEITDARNMLSLENLESIMANEIKERTPGSGVTIDGLILKDGVLNQAEQGGDPSTPATNRWLIYPKSDGYYIMGDDGIAHKIAVAGLIIVRKAPASAAAGEVFENSTTNTLSYKDTNDAVVNYGVGGIYGETITKGQPLGRLGFIDKGVATYAPSHDTYINQTSPATNYNASAAIETSNNGGNVRKCLFKFANLLTDLGITVDDISQIHSFQFKIYRNSAGGANNHSLKSITETWDSTTVTHNTAPAIDTTDISDIIGSSSTGYITFTVANLTPQQAAWVLSNGFALVNAGTPVHQWSSLEGANAPYITSLVYVGTDGKLHRLYGTSGALLEGFMGIAPKDGVLNDTHPIIGSGSIFETTGLTKGAKYFISDAGGLSTTPGTYGKEVGEAISTTQLLVRSGPCYFGAVTVTGGASVPVVKTIDVPKGANMIVVSAQTTSETSRSIKSEFTLFKVGKTSGTVERFESGVWMVTQGVWSGNTLTITFNGTGSPTSGSATAHFYKI